MDRITYAKNASDSFFLLVISIQEG